MSFKSSSIHGKLIHKSDNAKNTLYKNVVCLLWTFEKRLGYWESCHSLSILWKKKHNLNMAIEKTLILIFDSYLRTKSTEKSWINLSLTYTLVFRQLNWWIKNNIQIVFQLSCLVGHPVSHTISLDNTRAFTFIFLNNFSSFLIF